MSTTFTVRMDEDLLERLRQTALRESKSLNQLLVEGARWRCAEAVRGISVREAMAPYIGVVDSGGGYDASRTSDEFGDALDSDGDKGRL